MTLTLAGIGVALAILWANLRPWWKGGRDPKALIPFISAWLLGALATICIGGLLGWGADSAASGLGGAGDTIVRNVTGTNGAPIATTRMGTLTPPGGVVVALHSFGMGLLFKTSEKKDKRRIIGGLLTGAVLAVLPGIADNLGWLSNAVNAVGDWGNDLAQGRVDL